ncbi:hypothetical protein [Romboutsia timonensis]|nr:hypothetical protein [Romboutsia timonensis]MDY3960979.1 hypothetical protein [Romboutsia timonensis]
MYTKFQLVAFMISYIFLCIWIFYGLMKLNRYLKNKIRESIKEGA